MPTCSSCGAENHAGSSVTCRSCHDLLEFDPAPAAAAVQWHARALAQPASAAASAGAAWVQLGTRQQLNSGARRGPHPSGAGMMGGLLVAAPGEFERHNVHTHQAGNPCWGSPPPGDAVDIEATAALGPLPHEVMSAVCAFCLIRPGGAGNASPPTVTTGGHLPVGASWRQYLRLGLALHFHPAGRATVPPAQLLIGRLLYAAGHVAAPVLIIYGALSATDPKFEPVARLIAAFWLVAGVAATGGVYQFFNAMLRPVPGLGGGGCSLLDSVLQQNISAAGLKRVTKEIQQHKLTVLVVVPFYLFTFLAMAQEAFEHAGRFNSAYPVLGVLGVLGSTFSGFQGFFAAVLLNKITCVLVTDRIDQLAERVRRADADSADYGSFAESIHKIDELVNRLSKVSELQIVTQVGGMGTGALACIMVALRTPSTEAAPWMFRVAMSPTSALCWAQFFVLMAVLSLSLPAKLTSACQRVATAVNSLRFQRQPGGGITLAEGKRLLQIEGLERAIQGLNRGQGLGFCVMGKRVTRTLVLGLLIQSMSAMLVINGTMMQFVGVEVGVDETEVEAGQLMAMESHGAH